MKNKKNQIEKCCICKKLIEANEKTIKVKEKILYEDEGGVWYNFKTSYICSFCLDEIRNKVKAQV
jgi:hypothetical protein